MAKVLVIEDDLALSETVVQWLEHQHFTVEAVANGLDGLERLKYSYYDAAVLDVGLPDLDGFSVLQKLRAANCNVPVLLLTGKNAISDKEMGFNCGADDYLTKPFHVRELVVRLKALIRRPHDAVAPAVFRIHNLELDVQGRILRKDGEVVRLMPRDFALLEFLMKHPDQIFTNDELISRVWSLDAEASDDSVRSSIKRIRQKIDTDGAPSLIENVPKLGYRLIAG
jgi:two-component system OmpR family response regulator